MKRCEECGVYVETKGFDCPRCGALDSLDCLVVCIDCGRYTVASDAIIVGRIKKKLICHECVEERMERYYEISGAV